MRKSNLQISVLTFLFFAFSASAQTTYPLYLKGVDKDSTQMVQEGVKTNFVSKSACADYISKLPAYLQSKGYLTASIDSVHYDNEHASMSLYMGTVYKWAQLNAGNVEPAILDAVGWREKMFNNKLINFNEVSLWEDRILNHLENTGYPFAKVSLDSLMFIKDINKDEQVVSALLAVNKGPLYKIDSIRVYGNAKISNAYLQRYLDIPNGAVYNKEKLLAINKKISELTYIEEEKPANLSMLGTGSVLNVYLKPKKSSQVNAIIGFLPQTDPSSSKKLLITGEVNLLLRNVLGVAETFGLNFQKLQVQSEKLNFLFQYPYLFRSPIGLDFAFDLFRKDSSYVNRNIQLGAIYNLNANEGGKLFIQSTETIVNEGAINSAFVIQSRRLPDVADVSSVNIGIDYQYNKTDYRFNPKKGTEVNLVTSIGTKKLKKNNTIIGLKDPNDPSYNFNKLYDTIKLKTYQLRIRAFVAKYFPLGNQRSTIKTALNAGMFQSGNIFRNELFQLGGYRLLRGFDEESQYLSSFAIATLEYHYLIGQNSYFFVLADGGWGQDNRQKAHIEHTYFGTGVGLAFETNAGIFNLAWAIGKRDDTKLDVRQSKIHFGFVNYF